MMQRMLVKVRSVHTGLIIRSLSLYQVSANEALRPTMVYLLFLYGSGAPGEHYEPDWGVPCIPVPHSTPSTCWVPSLGVGDFTSFQLPKGRQLGSPGGKGLGATRQRGIDGGGRVPFANSTLLIWPKPFPCSLIFSLRLSPAGASGPKVSPPPRVNIYIGFLSEMFTS